MISKEIAKYTVKSAVNKRLNLIIFISLIIFWFVFGISDINYITSANEIRMIGTLFNLMIVLTVSSGIIQGEKRKGYFDLIFSKPIRKETFYLSKFLGALFVSFVWIIINFILFFIYQLLIIHNIPNFIMYFKLLLVFLVFQICLLSLSTFLSIFCGGNSNIILLFVIIIMSIFLNKYLVKVGGENKIFFYLQNFLNLNKETNLFNVLFNKEGGKSLFIFLTDFLFFNLFFLFIGSYIFRRKEILD